MNDSLFCESCYHSSEFVSSPMSFSDYLNYEPHSSPSIFLEPCKSSSNTLNENRLLVCHDMKGNYLQDKNSNGSYFDPTSSFQWLAWSKTDIFCYFSHHFITIPPISVVNCCRRFGILYHLHF